MKYCPSCGVALGEDAERCPLCGAAASSEPNAASDAGGTMYPRPDDSGIFPPPRQAARAENELSASERRRIAVELLSLAFGIALAVTILADLFASHGFTWSLYASVGIVAVWLVSAMPLLLWNRPWILYSVIAPSLVLLVFLLDAFDGRIGWFLGFGLPITLLLALDAAAVASIIGAMKRKGLNVLAVILLGIAAFCVGVEGTVDLNLFGRLSPDWSVIVCFALVPTAGMLFYLHYRIVHRASLRKLFRL
ncbi:MAG TPA: hypothetical protein DIC34_17320 [Treponema sp.]|nr:MAG: hypothetical protein A2Y36_03740 [Treponema sp. GWA1_62_8]OHE66588.1 MAG: hypothetical protein A2001_15125 [Treponema sp. GWC1_61_84]OHE69461.1 MAG: hypothetical protein A2413_14005 [Treponema sp. RIFOXYC1_FULL_61_9]HCM28262.1 hypothetical protein [Treponema sp.]